MLSFKVSLFIQFIQAWKRREFANFVCLALKLFRWKFPQTTQCSFKRHRHKQRAYFTVWFLSQIHCAETDWTPVWWQQEASTVLSCNFGLTLRWKWERGLWEMTDAAREGHWRGHMSSRGRTRPLSKGWGGGIPHYLERRGLGNAANLDSTDSAHLSVWPWWVCPGFIRPSYHRTVPAKCFSSTKHFAFSKYFLYHPHIVENKLLYCGFIRYYTYKSLKLSVPCSSVWCVLPALECLRPAPAPYFIFPPLSPSVLFSSQCVCVCVCVCEWVRGAQKRVCVIFNSRRLPAHIWYPSSLPGQMAITFQLWKSSLYKHRQDWDALDQV